MLKGMYRRVSPSKCYIFYRIMSINKNNDTTKTNIKTASTNFIETNTCIQSEQSFVVCNLKLGKERWIACALKKLQAEQWGLKRITKTKLVIQGYITVTQWANILLIFTTLFTFCCLMKKYALYKTKQLR